METLTQDEIKFIKNQFKDFVSAKSLNELMSTINSELKVIADKYQPLLDDAESKGDLELRKVLIEQMTLEAKTKEEEIRNN